MATQNFSVKRVNKQEEVVSIRSRTPDDHAKIFQLYQTIPSEELAYFINDVRNPKVLSQWFEPNELVDIVALVAETAHDVIGEAVLVRQKLSRTSHVGTVRFYIRPEWRKLGLGALLVSSILTEAMNIGIEKICVHIPEIADKRFNAMLTKTGFTREAVLKNHYRADSGAHQDIIVYGRDLEELWQRISDWVGNYGRAMEY